MKAAYVLGRFRPRVRVRVLTSGPSLLDLQPDFIVLQEANLSRVQGHFPNDSVIRKESLLDGNHTFTLNGNLWSLINLHSWRSRSLCRLMAIQLRHKETSLLWQTEWSEALETICYASCSRTWPACTGRGLIGSRIRLIIKLLKILSKWRVRSLLLLCIIIVIILMICHCVA